MCWFSCEPDRSLVNEVIVKYENVQRKEQRSLMIVKRDGNVVIVYSGCKQKCVGQYVEPGETMTHSLRWRENWLVSSTSWIPEPYVN